MNLTARKFQNPASSFHFFYRPHKIVSSAYSLSGHVSITMHPSKFRRATARYLLQSLVINFDGQTELVTPNTGYTPYRICSVTKELAPQNPLFELNNESSEGSGKPCVWNVIFDLAIPGWLPSSNLGDCENAPIAIQYALHATAILVSPEQAPSTSYFACFARPLSSSLFPSLFPSVRTVRAKRCDIDIARVMAPTESPTPSVAYTVNSNLSGEDVAGKIPSDVLSKIAIMASVPEYVNMESGCFELRLRMRTCGLEPLHCKRLRLSSFMVDVHQFEQYRSVYYTRDPTRILMRPTGQNPQILISLVSPSPRNPPSHRTSPFWSVTHFRPCSPLVCLEPAPVGTPPLNARFRFCRKTNRGHINWLATVTFLLPMGTPNPPGTRSTPLFMFPRKAVCPATRRNLYGTGPAPAYFGRQG